MRETWKEYFEDPQHENTKGPVAVYMCGVMKGIDEQIDESILQWLSLFERMGHNRIAKGV